MEKCGGGEGGSTLIKLQMFLKNSQTLFEFMNL